MPNPREVLIAARALIADPEHWTQSAYAIENTGSEVYPQESNAYAFCSVGALVRVSGAYLDDDGRMHTNVVYDECHADLSRSAQSLFGNGNVVAINDGEMSDDPARAHKDVLAMFDKAIADAT